MTDDPLQIIARGPRAEAEAAARALDGDAALEALTYSILEEDEDRGVWRIDAYPVDAEEAERLRAVLASFAGLTTETQVLADADWLAMALSGLPPVRAGRFFVYGVHDRGRAPPNAVNLRIEAGAAFGTGHHGTTVGCLYAYDALLKRRRFAKVLDVGAGTGVLAIAAAKTGARVAVGTDIDPISVRIGRENAQVNRVRARFVHADGLKHAAGFDPRTLRPGVRQHPGPPAGVAVRRHPRCAQAWRLGDPVRPAAPAGAVRARRLPGPRLSARAPLPPRRLGHPGAAPAVGYTRYSATRSMRFRVGKLRRMRSRRWGTRVTSMVAARARR